MNPKQPEPVVIKNETDKPKTYHGFLIPPHTTRIFDAAAAPRPQPAGAPAPVVNEQSKPTGLDALVLQPAKDVIAELPALSDDDLQALKSLEDAKGKKSRSSVLAAIETEQLERGKLKEFAASLDGKTEGELTELLVDYAEGSAEHGIIGERIELLVAAAATQ